MLTSYFNINGDINGNVFDSRDWIMAIWTLRIYLLEKLKTSLTFTVNVIVFVPLKTDSVQFCSAVYT